MAHISEIVERMKAKGIETDEAKVTLMLQRSRRTVEGWLADDDSATIQVARFHDEPLAKPKDAAEAEELKEKYSFGPSVVKD